MTDEELSKCLEIEADRDCLKIENERLQAENNILHKTDKWRYENVLRMKAEIERLQDRIHELETAARRRRRASIKPIPEYSGFTEDEKRIVLEALGRALEGKE